MPAGIISEDGLTVTYSQNESLIADTPDDRLIFCEDLGDFITQVKVRYPDGDNYTQLASYEHGFEKTFMIGHFLKADSLQDLLNLAKVKSVYVYNVIKNGRMGKLHEFFGTSDYHEINRKLPPGYSWTGRYLMWSKPKERKIGTSELSQFATFVVWLPWGKPDKYRNLRKVGEFNNPWFGKITPRGIIDDDIVSNLEFFIKLNDMYGVKHRTADYLKFLESIRSLIRKMENKDLAALMLSELRKTRRCLKVKQAQKVQIKEQCSEEATCEIKTSVM